MRFACFNAVWVLLFVLAVQRTCTAQGGWTIEEPSEDQIHVVTEVAVSGNGPRSSSASLGQYRRIQGSTWEQYGWSQQDEDSPVGIISTGPADIDTPVPWATTAYPTKGDFSYPIGDYKLVIVGQPGMDPTLFFSVVDLDEG